jgi:hypothetical protein
MMLLLCRCGRFTPQVRTTVPLEGRFGHVIGPVWFGCFRRAFEASDGDENPDFGCVTDFHVLVVANEAMLLRHGENAKRLARFSHFSTPQRR